MTDSARQSGTLAIGDLILDVGRHRLSRDGRRIDLPPLSFRLLYELALAAPNVLTQDELAERVWPGRIVTPETLTQRVKLVRRAIGDDAREPRYIGLVRGEGYRLLAPVEALPDTAQRPAVWYLAELLRRNVLQFTLAYAGIAWLVVKGAAAVGGSLPRGAAVALALLLGAGLPLTAVLAWRRGADRSTDKRAAGPTHWRLAPAPSCCRWHLRHAPSA